MSQYTEHIIETRTLTFGIWSGTSTSPCSLLAPFCAQPMGLSYYCHLRYMLSDKEMHTLADIDLLSGCGKYFPNPYPIDAVIMSLNP